MRQKNRIRLGLPTTTAPAKIALLLRPNGAFPEELVFFESAVVGFFVDAAETLGVPKSVAAIYGICFASPRPLSFSDIHQRLNISQGSISQGLKLLREVGALRIVHTKPTQLGVEARGERRDYYEPDLELRKLLGHYLEGRVARQLEASGSALRSIGRAIKGSDNSSKILKSRVYQLQNWHSKTAALLPIAKAFLNLT